MVIEPYFRHKASHYLDDDEGEPVECPSCPFCASTKVFIAELQKEHPEDALWECVCEVCYATGPASRTKDGALTRWGCRRVDVGAVDLGRLEATFKKMGEVADSFDTLLAEYLDEWRKVYPDINGKAFLSEDEQMAAVMSEIGRVRAEVASR
jgi:thiol-disulfide isomerase/thioredoxin